MPARVRCSEMCCAQRFKMGTTASNVWERSDFFSLFSICRCSYLFTLRFVLSLGRPKRSAASSVGSEKLSGAAQLSQFLDKLCLPSSIASSQGSWSWKASALALQPFHPAVLPHLRQAVCPWNPKATLAVCVCPCKMTR